MCHVVLKNVKQQLLHLKLVKACKAMCLHKSCIVSSPHAARLMEPPVAAPSTSSPQPPIPVVQLCMYITQQLDGKNIPGIFYSYNFNVI